MENCHDKFYIKSYDKFYIESYADIVGRDRNVSITTLYVLSLVNTYINKLVQPAIDYYKKLRQKYTKIFAKKLHKRLINSPIKHSAIKISRIITQDMYILPNIGLLPFINFPHNNYALSNICLFSYDNIPITFTISVKLHPIYLKHIPKDKFIKLDTCPGKPNYFVDLELGLENNPIPFGEYIRSEDLLIHYVHEQPEDRDDAVIFGHSQVDYHNNIHSMIIQYSVLGENYDWCDYDIMGGNNPQRFYLTKPFVIKKTKN